MHKFFSLLLLTILLNTIPTYADMNIIVSSEEKIYSTLVDKITSEGAKITKLPKVSAYSLQAINDNEEMVGGLAGFEFYGSFVIDVLWVEPEHRHKSIGSLLLKKLEEFGKEKGLKFISVSTMEFWGALHFYEKNGFEIEFVRNEFANNYKQYHLIKKLS